MAENARELRDAPDHRLRIVVPRFGAAVVGGAESAMRRLGGALAARGWKVDVWTTTALDEATWAQGFGPGTERDGAVMVRRFPVVGRRNPRLFAQLSHVAYHLPPPLNAEHVWALAQGPYAPALVRALATAPAAPTLFHPYLFHPTLYGIPAAPHPRILAPAAHDEPALQLRVVRRAVMASDALWFNTTEERDLLLGHHPGARSLPSEIGMQGIEAPRHVDRLAFAARHRLAGPYLYYGGRAAASRGLEELVEGVRIARAAHPSLHLVVSGHDVSGEQPPWMRAMGLLDEQERWDAIAGATAVVVPGSLESLSLLALEAWAVGRPCLVNGRSAVLRGHIARGGGGYAFGSSQDLAARAGVLLDDPALGAALGEAGQRYVADNYRWDLVEQRLLGLVAATAS